ncbi:MAG: hypothetical protein M3Z00_10805 [Actinomycetota bacterium]|nr:hypothetical protein [Actinomycetota bacterium]
MSIHHDTGEDPERATAARGPHEKKVQPPLGTDPANMHTEGQQNPTNMHTEQNPPKPLSLDTESSTTPLID